MIAAHVTVAWIGPLPLAVLGLIALVLFSKSLPKVGRSLGGLILDLKDVVTGNTARFEDQSPEQLPHRPATERSKPRGTKQENTPNYP